MTTTAPTTRSTAPSRTPLLAVLGAGYALAMSAVSIWWTPQGDQGLREYLFVVAIVVVATGLVFGLLVRRAHGGGAATRCLVLGLLSLATVVVFWSGLPFVLAAAAAACALAVRQDTGSLSRATIVGVVVAALGVVGATVSSFIG